MNNVAQNFVVDLDGTLLKTDLLFETLLEFVRNNPLKIFVLLVWLLKGRANLKYMLASSSSIDVESLPYNQNVIKLINKKKAKGFRIILATASNQILADRIAAHLRLFDDVFASSKDVNLSKNTKRDILINNYGINGFDYIGNSGDDLTVWKASNNAFLVNTSSRVKKLANREGNVTKVFDEPRSNSWLQAIRIHQWTKNLLVFVPLLLSHQFIDINLLYDGLQVFLYFGLCASSVYILNDLLDLRDDRRHILKKFRPFASGSLSIQSGLAASLFLLLLSFTLSILQLSPIFVFLLFCYYILTLIYSIVLKRFAVIDVIALSLLHTLRIIAGALALNIELSFWLLTFSVFIFLSLAMAKRYAEIFDLKTNNIDEKIRGRGYLLSDKQLILSFGITSGYISILVLALYLNDSDTLQYYSNLKVLWLSCLLMLTWISRIWLLTSRGLMSEDPLVFAIRDRFSITTLFLLICIFIIAI